MRQVAHITAVMVNRLFSSPFDILRQTEKTEPINVDFNIIHNSFPAVRNFEKFFGDNGLYFSYFNEVCDDIRTEIDSSGFVAYSHDIANDITKLDFGVHEIILDVNLLSEEARRGGQFSFLIGGYRYMGKVIKEFELKSEAEVTQPDDLSFYDLKYIINSPQYIHGLMVEFNTNPIFTLVDVEKEVELMTHISMTFDSKNRVKIYTSSILDQANSFMNPEYLTDSVTSISILYQLVNAFYETQLIVIGSSYCNKIQNGTYLYFVERGNNADTSEPAFGSQNVDGSIMGEHLKALGAKTIYIHHHNPSERVLTMNGSIDAFVALNENNEVVSYFFIDWFIHSKSHVKAFRSSLEKSSGAKVVTRNNNNYVNLFTFHQNETLLTDHRVDSLPSSQQIGLIAYSCNTEKHTLNPVDINNELIDLIYSTKGDFSPVMDLMDTLSKLENKDEGLEEETIKPELIMLPPLRLPVPDTGQVIANDLIHNLKNVIRGFGSLKNIDNIFIQNALYKYLTKHLSQDSDQYIVASPIFAYSEGNNYLDFWSKMNKVIKNDKVLKEVGKALKMDTLTYIECKTEKGRI
jgi:hypothetical protein